MKKSILFVDDEPRVIQALQHILVNKQNEWHMEFADSGAQAVKLLSKIEFHAVVADLFMPGMDGAQLLEEVRLRSPHTTRIVLCWRSDRQFLNRVFGVAHQYLYKPCDPELLKGTLARVLGQSDLLSDARLKMLVSQLRVVPSLPALYLDLIHEMQSENASLQRVGDIITRDPGMSAKIMQLVNSAFLGLPRHISSPAEAVLFLGIEMIKALVLSLQVFSQFDHAKIKAFNLSALWKHSWEVAKLAKQIAGTEERNVKQAEQAFTAGLLHDIGKLLLAANLPSAYQEALDLAQTLAVPVHEAERTILGASHAEVGGYLLGLWGLAQPVVDAVAFHHHPAQCTYHGFSPLTAVHAADVLAQANFPETQSQKPSQLDMDYLTNLGRASRLTTWQELAAATGAPSATATKELAVF
jgi:putative nucleotidyltransferase with HDIG domain